MLKIFKNIDELIQLKLDQLKADENSNDNDKLFNCIKSLEAGSTKISAWALSILGGTILIMIGTDHKTTTVSSLKLVYLLFILGWALLGISLLNGKRIVGKTIAAELYRDVENTLNELFVQCNRDYRRQLLWFNWALVTFGLWLILYTVWWIFGEETFNFLIKK